MGHRDVQRVQQADERIPTHPALRQACWRVLDLILALDTQRDAVDEEVGGCWKPPSRLEPVDVPPLAAFGPTLDLGFSAPGNFSRFIKEHTGVSPSIFRRAVWAPLPNTVTGIPR